MGKRASLHSKIVKKKSDRANSPIGDNSLRLQMLGREGPHVTNGGREKQKKTNSCQEESENNTCAREKNRRAK